MKNLQSKTTFLILILFIQKSIGQTIIDYQAWNPSNPPCNIFANATNVPSSLNGNSITISHLTSVGQPVYNSSQGSVNITSKDSNGIRGTEFRISYDFLKGASYKITVNALRIKTNNNDNDIYLRTDLNNGGSGTNTSCNGTGIIDLNTSGNLKVSKQILNSSIANYEFLYNT
jgi:hypothetical protein